MIVDTEKGARVFIFDTTLTKKKFALWANGIDERPFEKIFRVEDLGNDEQLVSSLDDIGDAQKAVLKPSERREEDGELEVELNLEPLGMTIKAAKDYRKKAPEIYKVRMLAAVKVFARQLNKLLGDPKNSIDAEHTKFIAQRAVLNFIDTLSVTTERAVQLILEDGMASVGVNMLTQKLSPEVVRSLYYASPIWESYSRMSEDLITQTNDVIKHHLVVSPTEVDKYGKRHGFDRDKMVEDLTEVVGMAESRARTIARTESAAVRNQGKEIGFKIRDPEGKWRYKVGGPYDPKERGGRLREACREVIENTPSEGYTLEELKEAWADAVRKYTPKLTPRPFTGGPNCRHFPQKMVTRFDVEEAIEEGRR